MEKKLNYSFDDEPVSKFFYDMDNKKIEVHFKGYYDLQKENILIEKPCVFTIRDWKEAKSRVGDEEKSYDLNKHMGVFSMILYMEFNSDDLEMLVNTIDNRYITLIFKEPILSLKQETN